MLRSALSSGEATAETKGGKETEILHKTPFPAHHLRVILLQVARAAELELPRDAGNGILAPFVKAEGVSFPIHPGCAFCNTSLFTVFHCCLKIKPNW